MNAETFGIPLRQGRGRGGYRGRGGTGFRGGRGRSASRGSFGPPQSGGGYRGGYRGNQAGREFADLSAYRVRIQWHEHSGLFPNVNWNLRWSVSLCKTWKSTLQFLFGTSLNISDYHEHKNPQNFKLSSSRMFSFHLIKKSFSLQNVLINDLNEWNSIHLKWKEEKKKWWMDVQVWCTRSSIFSKTVLF